MLSLHTLRLNVQADRVADVAKHCDCQPAGCTLQVDRMDAIAAVHDFKVRVVVATDLASRGLDLANVNLVR
jgi:Helicase conserved C-terminal domain